MANICSNWINLEGSEENIVLLINEVKELAIESTKNNVGVSALKDNKDGYMFELYIDECSFSFESKWSPVFDSLRHLSVKYGVNITNLYEELGCGLYGKWFCIDGIETDIQLTDDEIDLVVEIDEDNSIWQYKEYTSDVREELLNTVLDEKISLIFGF